ncbi:hypothetical protein Q5H93_17870 [Hymenobacter sp. ASUV-10]|uniref:Outer membrane protein beta-barrel domain-containing protein n=1 Tax=Hymenobacter aranciens TaxID=3063996 RepID=A0ABT9BEC6_9BACT|nr:outer membrane beta-barrel protein [Hymenobacter sp. ASUV-10]MDO7876618.1 hypothetical protein [Hymenobacter sp. ASUV-10]
MPNKLHLGMLGFVLLLLGRPAQAQAQDDFQPGYLIRPAGDTARGQVRQQGKQRAQRECVFRTSPTAPATSFEPNQLLGYGLSAGPAFRRARLARTETDSVTVLRFMEVLVAGKASLLYGLDNEGKGHFFLQLQPPFPSMSKPLAELVQLQRRVEVNGQAFTQVIKQYQQTLTVAFADCPAVTAKVPKLGFSEDAFTRIVQQYNACVAPATAVAQLSERNVSTRLDVVAGIGMSQQLQLSHISTIAYLNTSLRAAASPIAGLQLGYNSRRLSPRLWGYVGVLYQRSSYTGAETARPGSPPSDARYTMAYEISTLRTPLVLRYEVGRGRLRPFVEAGGTFKLVLKQHRNEYVTYYAAPYNYPPETKPLFKPGTEYEGGWLVGLGVQLHQASGHHFTAQLRYEQTKGLISDFVTNGRVSTNNTTVQGLLGYTLFK